MKRKIAYALLSLVVAFGLWLYVITNVSPDSENTYYNIPVVLTNETVLNDRGLMLEKEEQLTVSLKLAGNRSDLKKLNSSNITVTADLSKIVSEGQHTLSYNISFPGDVPRTSLDVLSQNPADVKIGVAERKTREVPVVPVYQGTVPEGFLTDKENVTMDYETVMVTGPAKVVDQIKQAVLQVDLEGRTETISQSYSYILCDAQGEPVDAQMVVTDVEQINLALTIQRYKEVQLMLNVIPGGGATRQNTKITMDLEKIQISGSEQMLSEMNDTLVLGDLKLAEVLEDTKLEYEIKLPEGITNLTGKSKVSVQVDFQGLVKKTVEVSRFIQRGLPIGMEATLLTKALTVELRGPTAQIEAVTEEDLVVTVDLSNAQPGTDTYKATVTITNSNLVDLGTVGSYTVSVTVSNKK